MASSPPTELNLSNLAGGALNECAIAEMRRVCENIQDPNIKAEAKRKLQVEILFEPDETRQSVRVTYSVKASLPGPDSGKTLALVFKEPGSSVLGLYEPYSQPPLFEDNVEPLASARA